MFERIFHAMMTTLCIGAVAVMAVGAYIIHPALAVGFVAVFLLILIFTDGF